MHMHIQEIRAQDAWGTVAGFPRETWIDEVRNRDTQLGYWDWVCHQLVSEGVTDDDLFEAAAVRDEKPEQAFVGAAKSSIPYCYLVVAVFSSSLGLGFFLGVQVVSDDATRDRLLDASLVFFTIFVIAMVAASLTVLFKRSSK